MYVFVCKRLKNKYLSGKSLFLKDLAEGHPLSL
jgi:hypothetical protein